MSADDLPPLPASLRALISDEQRAPSGDHQRDAVRARVHATIGLAAGSVIAAESASAAAATSGTAATAGTAAGLAGAVKVTAVVAALAVGGGGTYLAVRDDAPAPPARTEHRAHREPPMPAPDRAPPSAPAARPSTHVAPRVAPPEPLAIAPSSPHAQTAPSPRRAPSRAKAPSPPSEVALLGEAARAISASSTERALAVLDEHARHYPGSVLGEERDALRIEALAGARRTTEAREHARRFLSHYPNSLHRSIAARVLATEPAR